MTVYYYEGAKILAPLTISSNEPFFDADTVSLKKQRASQGAQRWELSFSTLPKDNVAEAFIASVNNLHLADSMIMPQLQEVENRFTLSGNILTSNSSAAGDLDVTMNNDGSNTGLLPKGYFIKFANHDKIYVVTNDNDFAGSTNRTMNIFPALTQTVPAQTAVYTSTNATFTFFRDIDNVKGITFTDGILSNQGTINLIEAV